MTPWRQLALLALIMAVVMTAGWLWQRARRNAGIVDVLWSTGIGIGALLIAATGSGAIVPRVVLAVLGAAWAARLAWHLWTRVRHEPEDGRYQYLRSHWHGSQAKFFGFFMAQAALVLLFALPFIAVAANDTPNVTPWTIAAIVIWIISVVGESVADRQLARYRATADAKGKTFRGGLWRYSRHPNYFFEWVHWFAYALLAVGSPMAWLGWSGPVVMYVFLRWLSGVPFTEAQALRSRGEDYRDYQRTTPMLIPWFPTVSQGADHARDHR